MDEFKSLSWSWKNFSSDIDLGKSYHSDLQENAKNNIPDVFHSHLMNIDPTHLQDYQRHKAHALELEQQTNTDTIQRKFIDPRTNIEVTSFICDYRQNDFALKNIFLQKFIEASKLDVSEHIACINAINNFHIPINELSAEEQSNRSKYYSTIKNRLDEKKSYLEFLKRFYLSELSHRYHSVHPTIDGFIVQKWKKQLIELYQFTSDDSYRLSTALQLNQSEVEEINATMIHEEHYGNVPAMMKNIKYFRQSTIRLLKSYDQYNGKDFQKFVTQKTEELVNTSNIDVVIPLSIIHIILSNAESKWTFRLSVNDASNGSIYNPAKTVVFKKPLPALYLSGNERNIKGAKYLLRNLMRCDHGSKYCFETKTIIEESVDHELVEMGAPFKNEYKICDFNEYLSKSSIEKPVEKNRKNENVSYRIWEMTKSSSGEKIQLLVATKQDAFKRVMESDDIKLVNLSAKLEHQAEYGLEVMTKSELVREWCHQYFRPNTLTERFRFDITSDELLKKDAITLENIESDLKDLYGIERKNLLQKLCRALKIFLGFPVGEYLLQNDRKNPNQVKVYEKCEKNTDAIDLRLLYANVCFEKSPLDKIEWLPIDENKITDIHTKYQMLPCAFPHTKYYNDHNVKKSSEINLKSLRGQTGSKQNKRQNFTIIKPKDDSNVIVKRLHEKIAEKEKLKKVRQNLKKAKKRKLKQIKNNTKKEAHKREAALLETIQQISVDLYQAIDKPENVLHSTRSLSKRTLQTDAGSLQVPTDFKNKCQKYNLRDVKSVNVDNAKDEISKRKVSAGRLVDVENGLPQNTSSEWKNSNNPIVTRSGRVIIAKKK